MLMITFIQMLKRLTAILLLITLISSNCSLFLAYAGFQLNRGYIADNLCINKSRPWMHCNGKCYFMKKVHQAGENQKRQEAKDNLNRLEVYFFQEPFRLSFIGPKLITTQKKSYPAYTYQYSSRYIETIFRPPKQLV